MRIVLLVLVAAASTGCIAPARYTAGTDGVGWATKPVYAKEAPSTLVAVDGTTCIVTSRRFERIEPGVRVACNWAGSRR